MLPAEVLADFATRLRLWRIPYLRLVVHPKFVILKTARTDPVSGREVSERIVIENNNASELIGIALSNCIIDKLSIHCFKTTHSDEVVEAIRHAASSVMVQKLMLFGKCFAREADVIAFAESFRSIQELSVDTTINREAIGTQKVTLGRRGMEN